jgi:hypothetical protein
MFGFGLDRIIANKLVLKTSAYPFYFALDVDDEKFASVNYLCVFFTCFIRAYTINTTFYTMLVRGYVDFLAMLYFRLY